MLQVAFLFMVTRVTQRGHTDVQVEGDGVRAWLQHISVG